MKKILVICVALLISSFTFAKQQEPSIITATKTGDTKIIKLLLDKGADINECDNFKRTPLMHAVLDKNLELVKFLVENGAIIDNRTDWYNFTVFQYAIKSKDMEIIKYLSDKGAK